MTKNNKSKASKKTKLKSKMGLEDKLNPHPSGQRNPKILFYDIETTPLRAWIWRLGEQVIRHDHLDEQYNNYGIICIGYKWNDGKPAKIIHWDYKKQDSAKVIAEFDKLAKQADVVIGKNSDRFDSKHLNTQRLLAGLPGLPSYLLNTDDVESQFRKNFAFPSFSLDYLSKTLLKNGGKDDMEFQDWIDIVEQRNHSKYNKMLKYCKGDVENTAKLWDFARAHFKPKFNVATQLGERCCANCGSAKIRKNGTRLAGKTIYQMYFCNGHGGYAGKAAISKKTDEPGTIAQ